MSRYLGKRVRVSIGNTYTILVYIESDSGWRTVDEVHQISLSDVSFIYLEDLYTKVKDTGKRNTHAYIEGTVVRKLEDIDTLPRFGYNWRRGLSFFDLKSGVDLVSESVKSIYLQSQSKSIICKYLEK